MSTPELSKRSIAVVGAGTMGNGIAQVCALAGLKVTMIDRLLSSGVPMVVA